MDPSLVISRVVAGDRMSSAYLDGFGILIWKTPQRERDKQIPIPFSKDPPARPNAQNALCYYYVIEESGYVTTKSTGHNQQAPFGKITTHAFLLAPVKSYLVFITAASRIFAHCINNRQTFELTSLSRTSAADPTPSAIHLQHSGLNLAVFKASGEVVIVDNNFLRKCEQCAISREEQQEARLPPPIPALQNSGGVSITCNRMAFYALHATGAIICSAQASPYGDHFPNISLTPLRSTFVGSTNKQHVAAPGYVKGKLWFHPEQNLPGPQPLRENASGASGASAATEATDKVETESWTSLFQNAPKTIDRAEWDLWREFFKHPTPEPPKEPSTEIRDGGLQRWSRLEEWLGRPEGDRSVRDGLGTYFALAVSAGDCMCVGLVMVK